MRRITFAIALLLLGACNGGTPNGRGTDSPAPEARPSSTATAVGIDQPRNSDTIKGPNIKLVVRVEGARVVPESQTSPVVPGEGHLRVTLDNGTPQPGQLEMTIPNVPAGEHVLRVEFVASDNKPFDPRVESAVGFIVT